MVFRSGAKIMNTSHITLSGPGQVINHETLVIKKALEDAGFLVELVDDHPFIEHNPRYPDGPQTEDEYLNLFQKHKIKRKVIITTEHCPWGG
jgi:hypothetical protein